MKDVSQLIKESEMLIGEVEEAFHNEAWQEVEQLNDQCQHLISEVRGLLNGKSLSSLMLKKKINRLIYAYRELLTESIYRQRMLSAELERIRESSEAFENRQVANGG